MQNCSTLSPYAAEEIAALEAEGITLTPTEIVEINALGWAVQSPETRLLLSRGRPVHVGGAILWPLTLRAVDWLEANGFPLTEVSPAMGYAMAYGRSEGPELEIYGRRAKRAVHRWFRRLACTLAEFQEAVIQIDQQEINPVDLQFAGDPGGMTRGDLVALLCATCGQDADYWERRCSMAHCYAVLTAFNEQNQADGESMVNEPRIMADTAMGRYVRKLKDSREVPE